MARREVYFDMPIFIENIQQRSIDEFSDCSDLQYDLFLCAFGADSRSTYLINRLRKCTKKILVGGDLARGENASVIENLQRRHSVDVMSFEVICSEISKICESLKRRGSTEARILVDVSCMSRVDMGIIFSQLKDSVAVLPILLSIGYCLARYIRPPDVSFPLIRRVAPVNPAFSGWGAPASLPVDAIVSLGYEKGKAIGAVEYLEPRKRWVFIPNSPEDRFLQQVRKHNNLLIDSAAGTTIDYEVLRPADTYFQLLSLVSGLATEARPVLLPFGPKLFFAISLLVAMRIEKASVWHVDGDDESPDASPQASGHSVLFSCTLQSHHTVDHQT
jgi:hypothetical protein